MNARLMGRVLLAASAAAGAMGCNHAAIPPNTPAAVASVASKDRVYYPKFITTEGEYTAGSIFVVSNPFDPAGPPMALSAQHLMAVGDREVPGDQVPTFVKKVVIIEHETGRELGQVGPALRIPGATSPTQEVGSSRDLVAFTSSTELKVKAFVLAAAAPAVGDRVFLFALFADARGRVLHQGTVTGNDETGLHYELDENIRLTGASGAPVLNAAGEVVGLHSTSGPCGKHRCANANSVTSIRALLGAALRTENSAP
jgi:hypothetical protein